MQQSLTSDLFNHVTALFDDLIDHISSIRDTITNDIKNKESNGLFQLGLIDSLTEST